MVVAQIQPTDKNRDNKTWHNSKENMVSYASATILLHLLNWQLQQLHIYELHMLWNTVK